MTAQITNIDAARPEVEQMWYHFTSQDEAQMFVQWAREDLDAHEMMDYVDHDVSERSDETAAVWTARIDYIDRTPKTPEAA